LNVDCKLGRVLRFLNTGGVEFTFEYIVGTYEPLNRKK